MATPLTAEWETSSPDETTALGDVFGRHLLGGQVIGLCGHLGAGKTILVKGMACGNGLDDARLVTSPTFTLVHRYEGRLTLYHADAYRLAGAAELADLGFDEWSTEASAVVVEWADRVERAMPEDTLWISMASAEASCRHLSCRACGPLSRRCLDAVRAAYR